MLPFYFPDGKPSPRRFGQLINVLGALTFISLLLTTLATPPTESGPVSAYIPALATLSPIYFRVLGFSLTIIMLFLIPSLVLRYRRAVRRERMQMKWLGLFSLLFLIMGTTLASAGMFDNGPNSHTPVGTFAIGAFSLYLALFIPLGVANAIFRHRLY